MKTSCTSCGKKVGSKHLGIRRGEEVLATLCSEACKDTFLETLGVPLPKPQPDLKEIPGDLRTPTEKSNNSLWTPWRR